MANRLAKESSPYLRQHAENPVDWYPWGPEALERAVREERPILLSVGYSSCHWCHVMERESFEDPGIAALMNERFVNIKVDREERPDVDQIYMKAVQAMTGHGGWPMTVFLTPGRVPFFGGTYYPPEPRHGMPAFSQVLDAVHDAWTNRREEVESGGARLLEALRAASVAASAGRAGVDLVERATRVLAGRYDPSWGGFGAAPKFPQPVTLELMLRRHARTGEPAPLEMVVHTLRRMAAGGMRDHLGGGFHRYSVDERWLVPHFEKMLYDNALLARAYLDAWRLTGEDDLRSVVEQTLDYVLGDLRAPEGGFFSARDADSEGEEGRFYVWTPAEVDEAVRSAGHGAAPETAVDDRDVQLFLRAYDVTERGNFEGRSILHLPRPLSVLAAAEGLDETELRERIDRVGAVLLARRAEREPPFLDRKVIVAWNAMTIRALAEAGAALGRADWLDAAERAADFLLTELGPVQGLLHSWIDGAPSAVDGAPIPAFLDDVAGLGNALLSLHGATLRRRWLDAALALCDRVLEDFMDEDGAVWDTAAGAEELIVRPRDATDSATPSGPSLAAELLARAGHLTDDDRWRTAARGIVDREAEPMARFGPAFGRMLSVLDRLEADPVEVVIVGGQDAGTRALVRAAHADFVPGIVLTGFLDEEVGGPDEGRTVPLLRGRGRVGGRPAAYVCTGHTCRLPVTDPFDVREEIRRTRGSPSSR
jgi:uncharacterized protein YyaL (SSP411 family)